MDIEEREARAREYFRQGYNCCQSVAMAFCDVLGLDEKKTAELTSGFGGGMGRLREVCGAVSGMTFVAGALCPAANPQAMSDRTRNYALVQKFAEEFRQRNGSIVCRELLGLRAAQKESPVPSERTGAYYHSRPCEDMVGCAASILAQELQNIK